MGFSDGLQAMLSFKCATRSCLDAGGCPAAGHFILLAQNTSNQTKGHPAAPALRASFGLTAKLGGCATRPSSVHKPHPTAELEQCSPSSQFGRQTEAAQKGIWVLWASLAVLPLSPALSPLGEGVLVPSPSRGRLGWGWVFLLFGPLGPPPSSAAKPGDFCEDCLSAKREFRSSPAWRATQGTLAKRRAVEWGGFLWLPFFSPFVQTGHIDDRCTRTWVTLLHKLFMRRNHALGDQRHHEPERRIYLPG